MEICNFLKWYLHFIGIFKHPYTVADFMRVSSFSIASHSFMISVNYFLIFEAKIFKDYSESFLFGFSAIILCIEHLILILRRKDLMGMMDDLQDIINERARDPSLKIIYETTNIANNKRAKSFYTTMTRIVIPIFNIPIACSSFYSYYFAELGADAFHLAFPAFFPYDWRKPWTYLVTIIFQWLNLTLLVLIFVAIPLLFADFCDFLVCFVQDLEYNLKSFDTFFQNKNIDKRIQMKIKLCEMIQFHSKIKTFAYRFANLYSNIVLIFLSYATVCMCVQLLLIHRAINAGMLLDAVQMSSSMLALYFTIFLFCYFGENVTHRFGSLGDSIYQCKWYDYPLELQKYLPMMISIAQKPVYLKGFGSIQCTCEMLKKIVNTAFSAFTLLLRFEH